MMILMLTLDRWCRRHPGCERWIFTKRLFQGLPPGQAIQLDHTCLARLFHPAIEGGYLAPAHDRAKTKNQLAHDSEARALSLQSIDDLRLMAGQLGAYFAQQRRRHLRRQLSRSPRGSCLEL
jgi:hypothetical protein